MSQQTTICCTLNNVPTTATALQKSRLPFAIHLHPFAQDETIPIAFDGLIIRCAVCRAYINPYVRISEQRSWQCNLCNRLNELPAEFIYDYGSQQYYDLSRKIELTSETVEYIANQEYMVRPPQPACYMFVFDCSKAATELGYIPIMAAAIAETLEHIPGDARASIGFLAYDSCVHYFSFSGPQVVHYVSPDVTTTSPPCSTDGILVNIVSKKEMVLDFLTRILPTFPFDDDDDSPSSITDNKSSLGRAIKIAVQIVRPIGGMVTVVQAQLPNHGSPGDGSILQKREDPSSKKNMTSQKNGEYLTPLINSATDFYKNLSLESCEHQISINLFNLSTSFADIASLSQLAKFSNGNIYHYSNTLRELRSTLVRFDQDFRNYLVRPLGLESVIRLRLSRGLKIHTFHGNFFVRSSNLLTLPIANPNSSYALQIAIEDDLKPNTRYVYFQSSLLYTSPEGERRIRVCTARYPVVTTLPQVIYGANQTAIIAMLAKMAVDRSLQTSVGEAKEALIGAGVDILEIYSIADEMRSRSYAMALPENLRLMPLFILALLKHVAFKLGPNIRLDDRVAAMERFKTIPVDDLMTYVYPDLYPLHGIANDPNDEWKNPISLTAAHIEKNGAYFLDAYDVMIVYICQYIDPRWCYDCFGVNDFESIVESLDGSPIEPVDQNSGAPRPRDPANFMAHSSQIGPTTTASLQKGTPQTSIHQLPSAADIANEPLVNLPELDNVVSTKLREFVCYLIETRAQRPKIYIMKETSRSKSIFNQYLVDDRSESYHSYAEFWKFLLDQANK